MIRVIGPAINGTEQRLDQLLEETRALREAVDRLVAASQPITLTPVVSETVTTEEPAPKPRRRRKVAAA